MKMLQSVYMGGEIIHKIANINIAAQRMGGWTQDVSVNIEWVFLKLSEQSVFLPVK